MVNYIWASTLEGPASIRYKNDAGGEVPQPCRSFHEDETLSSLSKSLTFCMTAMRKKIPRNVG